MKRCLQYYSSQETFAFWMELLRGFACEKEEVRDVQRQVRSGTSRGWDFGHPGIIHLLVHAWVFLHLWQHNAVSGILHEERHRRRHHLQVHVIILGCQLPHNYITIGQKT